MGSSGQLYVRDPGSPRSITLMPLRKDEQLDFDAMDAFIANILDILKEQGRRAVRVFPPDAGVLISFAERLANEVVR